MENTSNLTAQLVDIIESDQWMIDTLKVIRDLNLNDCWIGAGFVRNKVWDYAHGKIRSELNDIDVIHFNKTYSSKKADLKIEAKLKITHPTLKWSVKNQSRMHLRNGHKPYENCNEAISFWPETATAIAVRLNTENQLEFIAPYGLKDLFLLIVQPTPNFNSSVYLERIEKKKWKEKWNKLEIITP